MSMNGTNRHFVRPTQHFATEGQDLDSGVLRLTVKLLDSRVRLLDARC